MSQVNRALRDHVTSANFTLVLGSTHIAALVWVDFMLRRNRSTSDDLNDGTFSQRVSPGEDGPHQRAFRNHATGIAGLYRRGLVVRLLDRSATNRDSRPTDIWEITDAGRLVIGLLKESGLWAEFGGEADDAR